MLCWPAATVRRCWPRAASRSAIETRRCSISSRSPAPTPRRCTAPVPTVAAPWPDDDAVVDRLCQVLSDVPLAIELAAARSSILSPTDMIRDLTAVTATIPKTSATARWADTGAHSVVDVVAWAVGALSPDAVKEFRRCAVFPGGFTMDAARAMAEDELGSARLTDAFAELAAASLIEVRFRRPGLATTTSTCSASSPTSCSTRPASVTSPRFAWWAGR